MTVYDLTKHAECSLPENAAVALGNFDGVHIGHRRLFDALEGDLPKAVFTFTDLHRASPCVLTETDEKLSLIASCGVEYAILTPFAEVRGMTPEAFCDFLANGLKISRAVCGYNFTFGAGAAGKSADLERLLKERSVGCTVIGPVSVGGETVSSTKIRAFLADGKVGRAAEFLGRDYSVSFPVIHGRELGRTIGIPTVNQVFPDGHVIPKHGVYAVRAYLGGMAYSGVCNIGLRPTVGDQRGVTAETHIIDFSGWLYGETVRIEFVSYLRPEVKFPTLDALRAQILTDIEKTKALV